MNTYRVYGKKTEIADGYYEVEYIEYREDGSIKCTGTEDFSVERLSKQTANYTMYTWDGNKVNKGGYRWFDYVGIKRATNRAAIRFYLKSKYPNAVLVQAR